MNSYLVIKPVADHIYCLTIPDQPAALNAEELTGIATTIGLNAETSDSLEAACKAIADKPAHKNKPVIICGSLYLAGEVLRANNTLPD